MNCQMRSLGFWNFENRRQDSLRSDCHPSVAAKLLRLLVFFLSRSRWPRMISFRRNLRRFRMGRARHSVRAAVESGCRRAKSRRAEDCPPYLRRNRPRNRLQQLIRIDIHRDGDVFGEWQFVDRFADEAAQTHDAHAADQNVETELAL